MTGDRLVAPCQIPDPALAEAAWVGLQPVAVGSASVPDESQQILWRMERTTKSANKLLARWSGAYVRVRELTVSLPTLKILLDREGTWQSPQNLMVFAGPVWMSGPFDWGDALLLVEVVERAQTPAAPFARGTHIYRLHDPIGFELFAENISVIENAKPSVDASPDC